MLLMNDSFTRGEGIALLKEIRLRDGKVLKNVFVDDDAFILPGFLGCRIFDGTVYVAVSDIVEISVTQEEKGNVYKMIPMFKPLKKE